MRTALNHRNVPRPLTFVLVTLAGFQLAAVTAHAQTTHTVTDGDTLYNISQRYGVTVDELKQWNQLDSDIIKNDQSLIINKKEDMKDDSSEKATTQIVNTDSKTTSDTVALTSTSTQTYYNSLDEAKRVAKAGFDPAKHDNWFVDWSDKGYTVRYSPVKTTPNPTNKPSQPVPDDNTSGNYQVKSGDTLYAIARRNGVTVADLKRWNQLNSDLIQVGTQLTVKGQSSEKSNQPTTDKTYYKSLDEAKRVARAGFDPAKHDNWFVDWTKQGYTVRYSPVKTTPPQSKPAPADPKTYQVKSGDTLYAIARRNGVTVADLKRWNQLNSDLIQVGTQLTVKGQSSTQPAPTDPKTYQVKSGDTLYAIARRNGVTVADLKRWNQLNSDLIQVGTQLTVKGQSSVKPNQPTDGNTYYKSLEEAKRMARAGFDSAKHDNWFVDWTKYGYTVRYSPAKKKDATPSVQSIYYTVQSGDSLWKIGKNHHVSVDQLMKWNGLNGSLIQPGQKLKVNSVLDMTNEATPRKVYQVKSGDNLWKIANHYGVTVRQLKEWNQLKSDLIYPGAKIVVK